MKKKFLVLIFICIILTVFFSMQYCSFILGTAPIVQIESPTPNTVINLANTTNLNVSGTGIDSDNDVSYVVVTIGTLTKTQNTLNYFSIDFDISTLTPKPYTINVVAYDKNKNSGSASVNITISGGSAPVVNITKPSSNDTDQTGPKLTVSGTITDAENDAKSVKVWIKENATITSNDTTVSDGNFSVELDINLLTPGQYTICAEGEDQRGNKTNPPVERTFNFIGSPPDITFNDVFGFNYQGYPYIIFDCIVTDPNNDIIVDEDENIVDADGNPAVFMKVEGPDGSNVTNQFLLYYSYNPEDGSIWFEFLINSFSGEVGDYTFYMEVDDSVGNWYYIYVTLSYNGSNWLYNGTPLEWYSY